jgi:hypothetical protein
LLPTTKGGDASIFPVEKDQLDTAESEIGSTAQPSDIDSTPHPKRLKKEEDDNSQFVDTQKTGARAVPGEVNLFL